ncbi:MAG: hypothetical protein K2J49_06615 [Muribaculaceae bacterium]|nr:hypothetical protein [Muribaculaceae bacterium]
MKASFAEIARRLNAYSASSDIIDTLLTDSRNLRRPASSLFFAINTTGGHDGHNYIKQLYDRGVRHFVVNHVPEEMKAVDDAQFIIVDNTIKALQSVAATTSEMKADIVAITGSRGKTTLKEWIFQLMEPLCEIARSPRSFNSQIGVPLSLWEIEPSTSLSIISAGISKKR